VDLQEIYDISINVTVYKNEHKLIMDVKFYF